MTETAEKTLVLRLPKGYPWNLPELAPGYFYMVEDLGCCVAVYYRKKVGAIDEQGTKEEG